MLRTSIYLLAIYNLPSRTSHTLVIAVFCWFFQRSRKRPLRAPSQTSMSQTNTFMSQEPQSINTSHITYTIHCVPNSRFEFYLVTGLHAYYTMHRHPTHSILYKYLHHAQTNLKIHTHLTHAHART